MRNDLQKCSAAEKQKGFTLIELLIVIVIGALMMGGALSLYKVHTSKQTFDVTKQRLENIRSALAAYQSQNGHLPCPAPLNVPSSDPTFGRAETTTCSTSAPVGTLRVTSTSDVDYPADPNRHTERVRIGSVPIVELGLSVDDSVDKWGHRIVYAVSEKLADSAIDYQLNNGAITMLGNGNAVQGPITHRTPFVVYSHGPSGAGAISAEGQVVGVACPVSGPGVENCQATSAATASTKFRTVAFSASSDVTQRADTLMVNTLILPNMELICGGMGMIYGPDHPVADANGCVPRLIQNTASGTVNIGQVTGTLSGAVVDINGEMRVGASAVPLVCDATTLGAMRYALDAGTPPPDPAYLSAPVLTPEPADPAMRIFFCGPDADTGVLGWRTLRGPRGAKGPASTVVGPAGPAGANGPAGPDCVAASDPNPPAPTNTSE